MRCYKKLAYHWFKAEEVDNQIAEDGEYKEANKKVLQNGTHPHAFLFLLSCSWETFLYRLPLFYLSLLACRFFAGILK
jgi:hypothetical protein